MQNENSGKNLRIELEFPNEVMHDVFSQGLIERTIVNKLIEEGILRLSNRICDGKKVCYLAEVSRR